MKRSSTRLRPRVAWVVALVGVLAVSAPALAKRKDKSKDKAPKTPTMWAPGEIKWQEVPGMTGISTASLWGNAAKGAHGSLHKFAAGKTVALHSHSAEAKVVVVSGTLITALEGGAEKELPDGSYELMPGGVKHTTRCKAGADCVIVMVQKGPFDVKLVEGAAAAK